MTTPQPLKTCFAGVRAAAARIRNRLDTPVLTLLYHRVATLEQDPQQLAVTPDNFRVQMEYLAARFPLLRFEDEWRPVARPSVVITFDDGYADNARQALPILEETGVPATFFVTSGMVGSDREFWWDELERILLGEREYPGRFELDDGQFAEQWPTGNPEQRFSLYRTLQPLLKRVGPERRATWLERLRDWADLDRQGRESHRALNRDELRRLAASPLATIGGHTESHTPLALLSREEQRREIGVSLTRLKELTSREIRVFSYPFGGRDDYGAGTADICRELGCVRSAANFPGLAHRWTDPQQIPRHLVRNWPVDEFAKRMDRFWKS